ncbi:MAG: signal peptidase I [Actinobacteria bacterium]|nr:signal peptidase I [Actinomycetota bacterium]
MTAATGFTAKGGFFGATTLAEAPATPAVDALPFVPAPAVMSSVVSTVDDPVHLVLDEGEEQRVRQAGWLRTAVRLVGNLVMLVMVAGFTLVAVLPATGARAMIVLSGSMEPLLSAGDAAIIRDVPATDLDVGDVITFHGIGEDKRLTTHRIIELVDVEVGGLHFQTQGDANSSPDVDLAPAGAVVGRYDGRIPYGGRALLLLSRPEAKIVLVAVPALLILMGELRTLVAAAMNRRHERTETATRPVIMTVAMLLLAAALGVAATMATMAVMTDAGHAGDNTFSTATTFA